MDKPLSQAGRSLFGDRVSRSKAALATVLFQAAAAAAMITIPLMKEYPKGALCSAPLFVGFFLFIQIAFFLTFHYKPL